MWPNMIPTALKNMVRSEPSRRSATQPPRMQNTYTMPP